MRTTSAGKSGLLERLDEGPVVCAEGYLFECERRGYLQAGAFVPEVVLEHPEVVTELHREFVHAGSDVVEASTYYAVVTLALHREPVTREGLSPAAACKRLRRRRRGRAQLHPRATDDGPAPGGDPVGGELSTSPYTADMSKHAFLGTDPSLRRENHEFAEKL